MRRNFIIIFSVSIVFFASIAQSSLAQDTYTWRSVVVGGGGFVPGIIYHPTARGLVYARPDWGGAYRWDNSTNRWIPLADMLDRNAFNYTGVLSLALDPKDSNRVYMETGMNWYGENGALLSSTDKGNIWNIIPLPVRVGANEDGRGCGERLQVDPNADSILFMGLSSGSWISPSQAGLWRSTNFGASWSSVSSFTPNDVNFVLFDPTSSTSGNPTKRIFVAAVDTSGESLFESTDGGSTWGTVSGQPHGVMAIRAAIAGNVLYITFADIKGPGNPTAGSVWKYSIIDGTWTNISPTPAPPALGGYSGISVYPKNSNYVIVSTMGCYIPMDEVYLSTDGGTSWTGKLRSANLDHSYAPYTSTVNPHWLACIVMDPFDSSKAMFGTGYGIWACDNLFASWPTWYFRDQNLEETNPFQLISPPFTNLLSVMGDYDGFRHDNLNMSPPQGRWNPVKWTEYSIAFAEKIPSKIVKAYRPGSGNYSPGPPPPYGAYSTDGGTTWNDFAGYPSGAVAGAYDGQLSICISADGGTIVWSPPGASTSYSTDDGKTWRGCNVALPDSVQPVADPINPKKFYIFECLSTGQLWISTDGGKTFSKGAGGLPTVPSWREQDGRATTVPGHEGDLWICTGGGGLYHSTNSGLSASKISSVGTAWRLGVGRSSTPAGYPALYLWGIVNGILGIFRSDDADGSWTRINDDGHQFGFLECVTGDPRVYGRCYISTMGRGILYGEPANSDTTDNPTTFNFSAKPTDSLRYFYQKVPISWSGSIDAQKNPLTYIMHFFGPGVDTTFTTVVGIDMFSVGHIQPSSNYVLTGFVTNGFDTTASANAIWFTSVSSITTDVRQSPELPTSFVLYQNFPNPFNPSTRIIFDLKQTSIVTLEVYNVLGQRVEYWNYGTMNAGRYNENLNLDAFSSGVYLYRIVAVGVDGHTFIATRKLVLMK